MAATATAAPAALSRPRMKLTLSSEQQADFRSAFAAASKPSAKVTSDAKFLPPSTNKGMISSYEPFPPPPPAHVSPHSYEEDETFEDRSKTALAPSKTIKFCRAIPCTYVSSIKGALPFYRELLGFSLVGKEDTDHASIRRGGENGVQMYLRTVPMGPRGEQPPLTPSSLWILVDDVDALYTEVMTRLAKLQPKKDEYFPEHNLGAAKIEGKPQNKPWAAREFIAYDADFNKIIFFKELH